MLNFITYRRVLIFSCPLKIPKEKVMEYHLVDSILKEKIDEFSDEMEVDGIEIWEKLDNIVIAENGYWFALYEDEVDMTSEITVANEWQAVKELRKKEE